MINLYPTKILEYQGRTITISIVRNTGTSEPVSPNPFLGATLNTLSASLNGEEPYIQEGIPDRDLLPKAAEIEDTIKAFLDERATVDTDLIAAGFGLPPDPES